MDDAISNFHAPLKYPPVELPLKLRAKLELYKKSNPIVNRNLIQAKRQFKFNGRWYVAKIDQIRQGYLWEIKFSTLSPRELIKRTLPQLIVGAFAFKVKIGGVINIKNFGTAKPKYIYLADHPPIKQLMELLDGLI